MFHTSYRRRAVDGRALKTLAAYAGRAPLHIKRWDIALMIVLVTGGARSGKSRYAVELASGFERKVFIATAEVTDAEMRERIEKHKRERDPSFVTVEAPLDLVAGIKQAPPGTQVGLVDCVTVWLGNLLHRHGIQEELYPQVVRFLETLHDPPFHLVIVTNELGAGIVPENSMARYFRDLAGRVNQELARLADRVVLTVCGIPMIIKEESR